MSTIIPGVAKILPGKDGIFLSKVSIFNIIFFEPSSVTRSSLREFFDITFLIFSTLSISVSPEM